MVHTTFQEIRNKIARFIAPDYFRDFDERVNQRVAVAISRMDSFEPLMKEFHGVFSKEYQRPEEQLNTQSQIQMKMWGYQQSKDPSFKYLTEWIMNVQSNETLKRAPVTPERIMYGRAQVSCMILFVKEIGRLALLYEEILEKNKGDGEGFNSELPTE